MRASFTRRLQEAEARERQRIEQRRQVADSRSVSPEEAKAVYDEWNRQTAELNNEPMPEGEAIRRYEAMVRQTG